MGETRGLRSKPTDELRNDRRGAARLGWLVEVSLVLVLVLVAAAAVGAWLRWRERESAPLAEDASESTTAYANRYEALLAEYATQSGTRQVRLDASLHHEVSAEQEFELGTAAFEIELYELSIEHFSRSIEADGHSAQAYYRRGSAHSRLQQYDSAIRDQDQAIQLDPTIADAYNNRGVAHGFRGDYELAGRDFDRALELDPDNSRYYSNRAGNWNALGQYDRAIEDAGRAIELDPDWFEGYAIRGLAYVAIRKIQAAQSDMFASQRIAPDKYLSLMLCVLVHFEMGEHRAVIDFATRAILQGASQPEPYHYRGESRMKLGEWQLACNDLEQVLQLRRTHDPALYSVYTARAVCLRKLGRSQEAEQHEELARSLYAEWQRANQ